MQTCWFGRLRAVAHRRLHLEKYAEDFGYNGDMSDRESCTFSKSHSCRGFTHCQLHGSTNQAAFLYRKGPNIGGPRDHLRLAIGVRMHKLPLACRLFHAIVYNTRRLLVK